MVWKARKFGDGLTLLLTCLAILGLELGLTRAQGEDPGPFYRFSGTDTGCVNSFTCQTVGGCTEYPFTPTAGGAFEYRAWVACTSGECSHCVSCVRLYDAMPPYTLILCGTSDVCVSSRCEFTCDDVTLVRGHPYIMKVCLLLCSDQASCSVCENCTAHGCVTNTGSCY